MLRIEDISVIRKKLDEPGYEIVFNDGRIIWVTKARAVVALLVLIKYGTGSESDLAAGTQKIPEIKKILNGRYPPNLIKESYGDANKPFSELWNEEGFVWIRNPVGERSNRSQSYVLKPEDHPKFFTTVAKALRKGPSPVQIEDIVQRLPGLCNLCGAGVVPSSEVPRHAFSRDRLRGVWDHRRPVEKGGASAVTNFQLLCFYCNKSKWQICNICDNPQCELCVLAFPESNTTVFPTGEDISDRIKP